MSQPRKVFFFFTNFIHIANVRGFVLLFCVLFLIILGKQNFN